MPTTAGAHSSMFYLKSELRLGSYCTAPLDRLTDTRGGHGASSSYHPDRVRAAQVTQKSL